MKFRCIEVTLNYFENSSSQVPSLILICYYSDLLSQLVLDALFELLLTLISSHKPLVSTAEQQLTTPSDMMSGEYQTHLKMPLLRHFRQGSSNLDKNQQVKNWVQGAIN